MPDEGEDGQAGEERCRRVQARDGQRVCDDVLGGVVVRPKGDHLPRADPERVDDLRRRLDPGPHSEEHAEARLQVELQALARALERHAAHHQRHQEEVRERRGQIRRLADGLDALARRKVEGDPAQYEAGDEGPVDKARRPKVFKARRLVQDLPGPEPLRLDAVVLRAAPRDLCQAAARVGHVDDGPGHDDRVVRARHERHRRRRHAHAAEARVDDPVRVHRALSEALAHGQLQQEDGDADER
mmetsp:Transcript_12138/g.40498  ORF Transcript_12138/g.40498 Transcript_12138/m.40498 type:complete len:243 (+) Transcript_12138:963-1691(+)